MTYKIIKINPGQNPDQWDRDPYGELQMLKNMVKSNNEEGKKMKTYELKRKAVVKSDSTYPREYDWYSNNALEAADKYGRCEGGEVVQVYQGDLLISEARWSPEGGGEYYEVEI